MINHIPVLLQEVLTALQPVAGKNLIDATLGGGGYTRAFLEHGANVTAFDRDPDIAPVAATLSRSFPSQFTFHPLPFSQMVQVLSPQSADGVAFDLGVSSHQLDTAARGFSFQADGALDMRMAQAGQSAADVVNSASAETLADIFYYYGDERHARKIARAIVHDRQTTPFATTRQLASLLERILPKQKIHPATRTFQALRIYVNKELEELEAGLKGAAAVLKPTGVLAAVSFHSLEDGMVKKFIQANLTPSPKKSITAGDAETTNNPRARSAKLRVALNNRNFS